LRDLSRFDISQLDARNARYRDRRDDERFELKEAFGELIFEGRVIPCRFIDISLGGCCVSIEKVFAAGALQDVEVVLLLFGLVLRIRGKTQWATRDCQVGVRFIHPNSRSKNQLAGLLTCLLDEEAAEEIKQAVASSDSFQLAGPVLAPLSATPNLTIAKAPALLAKPASQPDEADTPEQQAKNDQSAPEIKARLDLSHASMRFLRDNTHLACDILDLSMGGCWVKTKERFGGELQARVEVCFQMLGLPFQLLGVTKVTKDKYTVEVEFLEMSRRKQEELTQVLEELRERERQAANPN
jgi:c-di-GMP-binding flagellar brake protein YcgR